MNLKLSSKALVAIVAVAIVASGAYAGYFHDQSIKSIYASLTPQIGQLNWNVQQLQNQVSSQQGQIQELQSAYIDGWFKFQGPTCYYTCTVNGAYANHGTQDARNIIVTLVWKNNGAFVQSQTITLGNLAGRSVALYPSESPGQDISVAAPANQLSWTFTWE